MRIKARKVQGLRSNLCIAHAGVDRHQDGPLLLLLHGALRSAENLMPWSSRWVEEFDVALIDLPGHGRSDPPPAATFRDFVDEVRFLVRDTFGHRRVVIIGESFGGMLGLAAGNGPPSNLAAVVALDPPLATAKLWPVIANMRGALAMHPDHAFLRNFAWEIFGVRAGLETPADRQYHEHLARLEVPTLVLAGDRLLEHPGESGASYSVLDEADRARLRAAPLSFEVIAGAGHRLIDECPGAVYTAVHRFIAPPKTARSR